MTEAPARSHGEAATGTGAERGRSSGGTAGTGGEDAGTVSKVPKVPLRDAAAGTARGTWGRAASSGRCGEWKWRGGPQKCCHSPLWDVGHPPLWDAGDKLAGGGNKSSGATSGMSQRGGPEGPPHPLH